jgi:O-antigen/teichoic acid export membrane protein
MSRFLKNSSLYLMTILILSGSSFLLLPLYTRLISPEDFGDIYLMQTTATVIGMVSSIQMRASVSRYYYDYKQDMDKVKKMYSSIVMFTFFLTSIIYSILFIFNEYIFFFLEVDFFPYMFIALLSSYLIIFYDLILALLYVEEKAKKVSITSIIVGISSILLSVVLVINLGDKLFAFLVSNLITAVIQFFIFIVFSKPYFKFGVRLFNIREFYEYSLQRLPMELSSWVVTFSDRIMVYHYIGSYENGIYSTGYKLGQIPSIFLNAINKAYVPYVFDKYSNPTVENNKKVVQIAQYLFSLYIVVIFGVIVFAKEFVYLLDERYKDSLLIMIIILFSFMLNGIKLVFHCPMDYIKKYGKVKSAIWMFSAFINIVLNVIFIPKYGIYGAAWSTFMSYLVTLLPTIYFSNRAINFKYNYKKMLKVFIVSLLYFGLVYLEVSLISFLIKVIASLLYITIVLNLNNIQIRDLITLLSRVFQKKKSESS